METKALMFGAVLVVGCEGSGRMPAGPGLGGNPIEGAATSADTAEDEEDDGNGDGNSGQDGGGGPVQFDVGGGDPDNDPEEDSGCHGVDFLFVIDSSISMENEQAALVAAFPQFIDTILANLDVARDFHILVTDTDAWGHCGADWCDSEVCRDPDAGNYVCNETFEECDMTLGAGVLHPAGRFANNAPCEVWGGNRYIVADEPNLYQAFECIATVGVSGNSAERPMDAMIAALQPGINGPGGCNEGFLRDDALLVVTFISDDPWYEDAGDPVSWYESVVAAKNGDESGVVVLGMTPNWPGCRAGTGPPRGSHWTEFIALWADQGLHGNVCSDAATYASFFDMAVSPIVDACDGFEPPG